MTPFEYLTTPPQHAGGSIAPAQPEATSPRGPITPNLTQDEIRRIVLDLLG